MLILTKIKQFTLLFGDFLILLASLYITLIVRYSQTGATEHWQGHFYPFAIIYFIWLLVFYSQNLYNLNFTKNNLFFFKTLLEAFLINIFIATFFFYFTPFFGIAPKTNLFLNVAFAGGLIFIWRGIFNFFTAKYLFTNKIAFLGYSKEVEELIKAFEADPQLGYKAMCVVHDEIVSTDIKQMSMTELLENIKKLEINTIVIHHGKNLDNETANKLYKLIFSELSFVNLLNLYEEITGKLPLETLSRGWFLENLAESEKKIYDRAKILIDFGLAFICGTLLIAVFPFVALIVLATDRGPIFYSQYRVGRGGKPFKIHKFRTMIKNAENGNAVFAQKSDNRITPFGKFLRKTRIDELPQIINVLRGEMSFIGPRPERPEFVEELSQKASFYSLRHLSKPGLTGWAQINYPYAGNIEENIKKLQYDIYYIKNRSFLLDIAIILKTFNIILRFKGR
ncbi:sugar transferase [Candidatus Parcubacteria bacterium]|nr:sugar transferase [Patescibacteria group bacterium]MCG2694434.1 sugar transferase [Candidatus Parcubacteria bacterium]